MAGICTNRYSTLVWEWGLNCGFRLHKWAVLDGVGIAFVPGVGGSIPLHAVVVYKKSSFWLKKLLSVFTRMK